LVLSGTVGSILRLQELMNNSVDGLSAAGSYLLQVVPSHWLLLKH
jgi:hypothetical protein